MIERIRLTAAARNQLITLKRKTGLEHYNSLCRHALCISLANPASLVKERLIYTGGLEIDWKVLTGGYEALFINLLMIKDGLSEYDADEVREMLCLHIHRGLSYMSNISLEEMAVHEFVE